MKNEVKHTLACSLLVSAMELDKSLSASQITRFKQRLDWFIDRGADFSTVETMDYEQMDFNSHLLSIILLGSSQYKENLFNSLCYVKEHLKLAY